MGHARIVRCFPMIFRLYNTLTKQIEPFTPADPTRVTFYTCGPTVYDDAHIGNFRSFLAADLLRRWLESPLCTLQTDTGAPHAGPRRVVHVMNITDVGHMTDDDQADGGGEDKMVLAAERLLEAKKSGKIPANARVDPNDPYAVAAFYRDRFLEDARALGLKVAVESQTDQTLMPQATDHIAGMKRVIERLLADGAAYTAGTPGSRAVYFSVQHADAYGKLSGNTLDKIRGGAGGRVDDATQQEKHHPADFLLWKEDPSHKMKWPSPVEGWDEGYPGWHIECTAMAFEVLLRTDNRGGLAVASGNPNAQIDLHSGGEDNIFPHHECEIAQSCAFTGADHFARHWFHPRFLMVNGAKMSKSKGTFYTPRDLIAKGIDPAAIRLELIKTHYRTNADFSMQGLKDSARTIERWRSAVRELMAAVADNSLNYNMYLHEAVEAISEALSEDLNVAQAIGVLNTSRIPTIVGDIGGPGEELSTTDERLRTIASKVVVPSEPQAPKLSLEQVRDESLSSAERSLAAFHLIDNILGVIFRPVEQSQDTGIAVYLPGATPSDEVEALLTERRDAKKSKDFARSDAIRDQLATMGYALKDIAGGKVEVSPKPN